MEMGSITRLVMERLFHEVVERVMKFAKLSPGPVLDNVGNDGRERIG